MLPSRTALAEELGAAGSNGDTTTLTAHALAGLGARTRQHMGQNPARTPGTQKSCCTAETVPGAAAKVEDGVGVIIPKLKPVLGSGRREVNREHCVMRSHSLSPGTSNLPDTQPRRSIFLQSSKPLQELSGERQSVGEAGEQHGKPGQTAGLPQAEVQVGISLKGGAGCLVKETRQAGEGSPLITHPVSACQDRATL